MSEDSAPQTPPDGDPAKSAREVDELTKLKHLPEADQEAIFDLCRPKPPAEPGGEWTPGQTLEEARANILLHYEIELGHNSQLSRWRSWYRRRQELRAQNAFAEFLEENPSPNWSAEEIRQWQLRCINSVADESRDPKLMLALARELRAGETLALAKAKWQEAAQKKLEAGLAALHEEIKGNPAALAIFEQLQAAVEGKA